jgi:lipopolysaccharide export system permease protein
MPLTLYRYLAKEILSPFLLGLVVFTSVLLMGRMLKLAEMVVSNGVPLTDILLLIYYLLPYFAVITIPMSLLLAVMLAFSRLSADSEIVAIKASGISIYRMLPPILTVAAMAYFLAAFVSVYALPKGNISFKELLYHIVQGRININLKEQVFNDTIPGLVIYVDRNTGNGRISGVLIQDERNPKDISTIFAGSGQLSSDEKSKQIHLQLADGSIHQMQPQGGYRRLDFQKYDLKIDLSRAVKSFERNEQDMTLAEIRENLKKQGFSKKLRIDMKLETYRRFALPFACFIFAIVAMPLGIQNRRSGKAAGFTLSIAAIVVYYIFQSIGMTLGEKELLQPGLAVWLPNIIFLAGGIFLFRQTAREQPFVLLERIYSLFAALIKIFRRESD